MTKNTKWPNQSVELTATRCTPLHFSMTTTSSASDSPLAPGNWQLTFTYLVQVYERSYSRPNMPAVLLKSTCAGLPRTHGRIRLPETAHPMDKADILTILCVHCQAATQIIGGIPSQVELGVESRYWRAVWQRGFAI